MVSALTSTFLSCSQFGTDVPIIDPTAHLNVQRGGYDARLLMDCGRAKRERHALNGATMNCSVV